RRPRWPERHLAVALWQLLNSASAGDAFRRAVAMPCDKCQKLIFVRFLQRQQTTPGRRRDAIVVIRAVGDDGPLRESTLYPGQRFDGFGILRIAIGHPDMPMLKVMDQ